jgi:CBS domain-containing protein
MLESVHARRPESRSIDPTARRIGDLISRSLLTCPSAATLREGAERMVAAGAEVIVVLDAAGEPVGTVCDSDLRRAVAQGLAGSTRIDAAMASPAVTIGSEAYFFEAVQALLRHRRRHLVVLEDGRPLGVIADTDLLGARAPGPLYVSLRIQGAATLDELAALGAARLDAVRLLQRAGLQAQRIARISAEINDQLVGRILSLVEAQLGPAPVAYCWLGLGSEGRREQTLHTDQDNALIFADPPAELADRAAGYFAELAERVVAALERGGLPRCKGGVNASNPRWCQPLGAWRALFAEWVNRPRPEALLHSAIFFDLRAVGGESGLADALWENLARWIPRSPAFTKLLLAETLAHRPAIRPLGGFMLDHGEQRGRVELKWGGLMPVVEPARIFALSRGITLTNTADRLRELRRLGYLGERDADDLIGAYEFLMGLRIRRQLDQLQAGQEPDDRVSPAELPRVEAVMLREHLKVVTQLQGFIESQLQVGGGS